MNHPGEIHSGYSPVLELTSNVSCVTIQHRRVSTVNLTRVVHDNNLSNKSISLLGWIVLRISSNHTTFDILDRDVLDIETNVVTRQSFWHSFMMHFNGFDFSGDVSGGECDNHTRLNDTSFHTSNRYCSNTTNLVHIL